MNRAFGLSAIGATPTERVPKVSLFPGGYDADPDTVLLLKLDEGEGVRAVDYSDYGNTGEIIGASWDAGRYGYGLHFDGINDHVVIPHKPTLDLAGEFCIETYVRVEYDGAQRIVEKPGSYFLGLLQKGAKERRVKFTAGVWTGGALSQISTGWDYEILERLHVAFQRDQAGYLSLVADGIEDTVSAFTVAPPDANTNDIYIGRGERGYFFQGDMDEVRISNVYRAIPGLDPNK